MLINILALNLQVMLEIMIPCSYRTKKDYFFLDDIIINSCHDFIESVLPVLPKKTIRRDHFQLFQDLNR